MNSLPDNEIIFFILRVPWVNKLHIYICIYIFNVLLQLAKQDQVFSNLRTPQNCHALNRSEQHLNITLAASMKGTLRGNISEINETC